uniref:Death-inducer obliterator 1 n=1 Tax=Panagrellus redivivus TaxID=6233 RepID=A0A7E4VR19_PANRE
MCIYRKKNNKPPHAPISGKESMRVPRGEIDSRRSHPPVHKKPVEHSKKSVAAVHKAKAAEKNVQVTIEEQKRQMEAAQKALGQVPNTTIIERIAEREKKIEATQEQSVQVKSTMKGDIAFSFIKKVRPPKDDDTVAPDFNKGSHDKKDKEASIEQAPNPEEELIEEDPIDDEPNSENYMYNGKEIVYTCHDMVRSLGKAELTEVAGDLSQADITGNVKWDPWAPLSELESRKEIFSCQTLRRNTLISNTLAMPTEGERMIYDKRLQRTQAVGDSPKKQLRVTFNDAIKDIEFFNVNHEMTVVSQTQSASIKRGTSGPDYSSQRTKVEPRHPKTPKIGMSAEKRNSAAPTAPSLPGGSAAVKSKEAVKTIERVKSAEIVKRSTGSNPPNSKK